MHGYRLYVCNVAFSPKHCHKYHLVDLDIVSQACHPEVYMEGNCLSFTGVAMRYTVSSEGRMENPFQGSPHSQLQVADVSGEQ